MPLTMKSTRANYVRLAINTGYCPFCQVGIRTDGQTIHCKYCGFVVPAEEMAQHLERPERALVATAS